MGLVLFCGVALASLRYPSDLYASVLFTLAVTLLLAAVVGVVFRRGRARAGCIGFVVFGWGYLILSFGSWFGTAVSPPALLTTMLLDALYPRLHPAPAAPLISQGWVSAQPVNPPVQGWTSNQSVTMPVSSLTQSTVDFASVSFAPSPNPSRDQFLRVGHSLLAFVAAFLGFVLARAIFTRHDEQEERGRFQETVLRI